METERIGTAACGRHNSQGDPTDGIWWSGPSSCKKAGEDRMKQWYSDILKHLVFSIFSLWTLGKILYEAVMSHDCEFQYQMCIKIWCTFFVVLSNKTSDHVCSQKLATHSWLTVFVLAAVPKRHSHRCLWHFGVSGDRFGQSSAVIIMIDHDWSEWWWWWRRRWWWWW